MFNEIVNFLAEKYPTSQQMQTLVTRAFNDQPRILHNVDLTGTPIQYASRLVSQLQRYGEIVAGTQALWHLLEMAKEDFGFDVERRINTFRPYANNENQPTPAESRPAVPALTIPLALIQPPDDAEKTVTKTYVVKPAPSVAKPARNWGEQLVIGIVVTVIGGLILFALQPLFQPKEPTPISSPTAVSQINTPMPTTQAPDPADTLRPTETPILSPDDEQAFQRALTPVTRNADWMPYERDFHGVAMVLVPAGQFEMGSTEDEIDAALAICQQAATSGATCQRSWYEDESGGGLQMFGQPFWIDQTEITRAQYKVCVDAGKCSEAPPSEYSTQPDQPINYVTWFQAETYCAWRDARLPTEREWEYAARGPEGLIFAWGNEFGGDEANHCDSECGASSWASGYQYVNEENDDGYAVTAPVGSFPQGASWVGAEDISGNVWEWTSSLYSGYPYVASDGREADTGERTDVLRVLRGGSSYDASYFLRAAYRFGFNPVIEYNNIGVRCARS